MRTASNGTTAETGAGWVRDAPNSTAQKRDYALDWVKGALVLLMVLYHWLNYFIGLDWPGYRYLRFLTPSFLFITGLIVGRVYLVKYGGSPWQLARRSWQRGFKLLALFALLNLVDTAVSLRRLESIDIARGWPLNRLEAVFLHGTGGAAFSILVPIAYFLLAVPLIWGVVKVVGMPLWVLSIATLALAITASQTALANAQLEFLSVGTAGAALGAARRFDIDYLGTRLGLLTSAYVLHIAAIAAWNAPFAMQVVTTYLHVLLLYAWASRLALDGDMVRRVLELGQYSLLAYVSQILALQVLRRALPPPHHTATLALTLLASILLTWGTVRAVAYLRRRSRAADQCYRLVFA
jgi:hypothetical protein